MGGGNHEEWYPKFSTELVDIYNAVDAKYRGEDDKVIFTGSGVIAYMLKYLDMIEPLNKLMDDNLNPHDLDFVYDTGKGKDRKEIRQSAREMDIGGAIYNLRGGDDNRGNSAVNFDIDEANTSKYVRSFDVTKNRDGHMETFILNNIRMITLDALKSKYSDPDFEKQEAAQKKVIIINQIIEQVKLKGLEEAFGLKKVETPNTAPKGSSMFGPDSDDEGDFAPSGKLDFGADSDNDGMGGGGFNGSDTIRSQDLNISD